VVQDADRFDAWLNRLVVRACHNVTRHEWRHQRVQIPLIGHDLSTTPDTQSTSALSDLIERGLERLTVDQRSVLVLSFYLDLPLAEVAAILGIPLGTVKSRLNRALSSLRASIEAEERPRLTERLA
jgi:RNA polymerase sigma-70 factor (ECF subfamily)